MPSTAVDGEPMLAVDGVSEKLRTLLNGLASVRLSDPVGTPTVTHQGAACDAASIRFD